MYSVFIVDDEVIVREGLRNKIDWEHSQFTFAGEAGDGELALSMIQDIKPDILITDIRMPFMDGLELARAVKQMLPLVRILILSGHDEFDYAKKAISIGVEDYILKPFTLEEVLAGLHKAAAALDRQRQQFTDIARMRGELDSAYALARSSFLSDVVLGTRGAGEAIQKAAEFEINLIARWYQVTVSVIHCGAQGCGNALIEAKARILALVERWEDGEALGFFIAPDTFVTIVKSARRESCEDTSFSLAGSVSHEVSKTAGCTMVAAIGSIGEHTAHIAQSYREASAIQKQCRITDRNKIISMNDIERKEDSSIVLQDNDPLFERLNYADESEIDQIIKEYIAMLGDNPGHFSIIASYLLVDVIMAVSKLIEELGGSVTEVMPDILSHSFVESAVQNEEVFIAAVRGVLQDVLRFRNQHVQGRYADVILRAKKYIDGNYANPDICLHSTAAAVNFSPNHFSAVFSQECGITVIEYLTNVRIEAAKKLLRNSGMKSADIAYEVGFNDPHYFSFIFKKVTGVSPRDWRNGITRPQS